MNPYIKLPKVPILFGRQGLILDRCRYKRVLHLGCVDKEMTYERFKKRELLHQKLKAFSEELWGVDLDAEGIFFMQSQGFENLIIGDICYLDKIEALRGKSFDVIVASEVLEHLQNPGLFLDAVKKIMVPDKTELIITVPNAFRFDTLLWLLLGKEYIHPDHYYWFSYHTITNLLKKNGYYIDGLYVYTFQPIGVIPSRNKTLSKKEDMKGNEFIKNNCPSITKYYLNTFLHRIISYLVSLPRRVIVYFLYKRTPFWADGIILIVRTNGYGRKQL